MSNFLLPADSTTLILNGQIISDLIEGDNIVITPPNPLTGRVNGIGGSVHINVRSDSGVRDVTLRVLRYSDSDVILNNFINQTPLAIISGSSSTIMQKDGERFIENWVFEGGSITTQPTVTYNSTDGNAAMEYVLQFRIATRAL